jgi:hypothetical protein
VQQVLDLGSARDRGLPCPARASDPLFLLGRQQQRQQQSQPQRPDRGRRIGAGLASQMLIFASQTSFEAVIVRVFFYFCTGLGSRASRHDGGICQRERGGRGHGAAPAGGDRNSRPCDW